MDAMGDKVVRRWSSMKTKRSPWDTIWQQIADYLMPRKSHIQTENTISLDTGINLYDSTLWKANNILAAGQMNYLTPAGNAWFRWIPPRGADSEASRRFCTDASMVAHEQIAVSNFYSEIHEVYLDRGGFGTGSLFTFEGTRTPLAFRSHRVSSYGIAEDSEGYVDTVIFSMRMSLAAVVKEYGVDALSPKRKETYAAAAASPEKLDEQLTILHFIGPREPAERQFGKIDGPNKPIASIHVDETEKHTMRVGGFEEMPISVSRFLRWNDDVWGYSPSFMALPEARSLNLIEKHLDVLGEVAAFPRILVPQGMEGEIDLAATGLTFFDPSLDPQAQPREWLTQGRYDIGLDRADRKKKSIEDHFHVDLFQMLAARTQEKTATEVLELVEEKLVQFSPNFARLTTEILNPTLARIFGLLLRQGLIGQPPKEMLQVSQEGVGVMVPQVNYVSRIALAIKALQNQAFMRFVQITAPLFQIDPTAVDLISIERTFKGIANNEGLPSEWMATDREVALKKEGRQAAAEAQMAMQAAETSGKMDPGLLKKVTEENQ